MNNDSFYQEQLDAISEDTLNVDTIYKLHALLASEVNSENFALSANAEFAELMLKEKQNEKVQTHLEGIIERSNKISEIMEWHLKILKKMSSVIEQDN